ncbi:MAG TPA: YIEGIA family protein [Syntrophomonadaceae bacterium]|nr:YIEGIA family protein [Syntrophomonadaceae bacterium]
MREYGIVILTGIIAGFTDRWLMLRNDYRYYPTYPHGHLIHLALGFIAAGLGAVAIPAIAKPDYTAVTFLALAAQQFREIRRMERETLEKLEENKLIKRGNDYIEGIARVFEARNYLCILTALLSSGAAQVGGWPWGIAAGIICIALSLKLMRGSNLGKIADVLPAQVHFNNSLLLVDDVVIMNVGLSSTRQKIMKEGLGVIIKPKNDNARLTLDAPGQRMAIIHDVVSILGSKVDLSETELMPMARKQVDKGYLGFFIVANEPDLNYLTEIIKKVPVLETSRGTTLNTFYGRKAAD